MSGYTPRVGDRVRATLGESVIVGEVSRYDDLGSTAIDVAISSRLFIDRTGDEWQFEQIVSVPSKFGAVIRRADGAMFARNNDPKSPWLSLDGSVSGATDETVTAGGFTVLFDGVDE